MSVRLSFSCISSCYLCSLLVVALFCVCLSNQNLDDVLCIKQERKALLKFKHHIIDETDRLVSWVGEKCNCCKWTGIVCENMTGHVIQIRLRTLDGHCEGDSDTRKKLSEQSSNFDGIIPPQLGNLSELHTLCLGSFQYRWAPRRISARKLEWLSNLRLLRHLDMSSTDLSKAIDWFQVINTLPSLAELHLRNSYILDVHPHDPSLNITSLILLDLSENTFTNSFASQWIFSITSLVLLDLSMCMFDGPVSGSIGYSFRNLTSLKWLHVSRNNFMNSSVDSLHILTSLLSLDLSSNQLTVIPKALGNLCNLRHIDLSSNDFRNLNVTYLLESSHCKSPRLASLSVSNSGLSGHLPDQLGQFMHMEHLDLHNNHISDLSSNQLDGSLPDSIGRILELSYNQFNGSLPNSLGQLLKLEELRFSSNLMTGVVTDTQFVKLALLKVLYGDGNNLILRPQHENWIPSFQLKRSNLNSSLGPKFPLWLQLQKDLVYLDISNTNISSSMPESFWRSFPNLEYMDISKNYMQGTLTMSGMPTTLLAVDEIIVCRVSFLNMENNNLFGEIPRTLGHVRLIRSLNMHGNKLVGMLPASLMNLTFLKILELSGNELDGSIPLWVGTGMSFLSLLNLRSNNIVGDIPQELCYIAKIQILDISDNKLNGVIPTCFNNFSILSGKDTFSDYGFSVDTEVGKKELISRNSLVAKGHEYMYSTILRFVGLLDLSNNNLVGQPFKKKKKKQSCWTHSK
ncbi:receptor-like protein EIX2 [Tanacetum coccineum]